MVRTAKTQQICGIKTSISIRGLVDIVNFLRQKGIFAFLINAMLSANPLGRGCMAFCVNGAEIRSWASRLASAFWVALHRLACVSSSPVGGLNLSPQQTKPLPPQKVNS
jgi:hypothetical protein